MNSNKYYITTFYIPCNICSYSHVITVRVYQTYPKWMVHQGRKMRKHFLAYIRKSCNSIFFSHLGIEKKCIQLGLILIQNNMLLHIYIYIYIYTRKTRKTRIKTKKRKEKRLEYYTSKTKLLDLILTIPLSQIYSQSNKEVIILKSKIKARKSLNQKNIGLSIFFEKLPL